jgi:hypothetical protein
MTIRSPPMPVRWSACRGSTAVDPAEVDVNVTLRHTSLKGDLVNSRSAQGDMKVRLENAGLDGRISTATQAPASGADPTQEYVQADRRGQEYLRIHEASRRTRSLARFKLIVDGRRQFYITGLRLAEGAKIVGPPGSRLRKTVNGVSMPIEARDYRSKIVVSATPGV